MWWWHHVHVLASPVLLTIGWSIERDLWHVQIYKLKGKKKGKNPKSKLATKL
jgi:hypothetical protein